MRVNDRRDVIAEERQHAVEVGDDHVHGFGEFEVGRSSCLNSIRSARPLACSGFASDLDELRGSTAITLRAPACAAENARTPVPVPMSRTMRPGWTASSIARAYASVRTPSRHHPPKAKRLYSVTRALQLRAVPRVRVRHGLDTIRSPGAGAAPRDRRTVFDNGRISTGSRCLSREVGDELVLVHMDRNTIFSLEQRPGLGSGISGTQGGPELRSGR